MTVIHTNPEALRVQLLDAALPHVLFDGWSDAVLCAAADECGVDAAMARGLFPRGGVSLALLLHERGDQALAARLAAADLEAMRFSARVGFAVMERLRIAAPHREVIRRSCALFALPPNMPAGARAMWGTADLIWETLGDRARDYNWYSKRTILSGVLSSALLYWLGDDSEDFADTQAFVDRRIDGVMRFETFKGQLRKAPFYGLMRRGPGRVLDAIRAPETHRDLPGYIKRD